MIYDIAIIGAGPAGLSTAVSVLLSAEEKDLSLSVLVIDKEITPGKNKPCGGMILYPILSAMPSLISLAEIRMKGITIVYKNNSEYIEFDNIVAINVKREKLADHFLRKFLKLGGYFSNDTFVNQIKKEKDEIEIYANDEIFKCKVLVGADGVNSIVAKDIFGYSNDLNEIGVTYQIVKRVSLDKIEFDVGSKLTNEFYYGKEYSPAGYSWFFPYKDSVKIGVGAIASKVRSKNLKSYALKIMRKKNMLQKETVKEEGYSVPLSGGRKKVVSDTFLLVGDSAHQVSPLSGAGIHLSILLGIIAGRIIANSFNGKSIVKRSLRTYERIWNTKYRKYLRIERLIVDYTLSSPLFQKDKKKLSKNLLRDFATVLVGKQHATYLISKYFKNKLMRIK